MFLTPRKETWSADLSRFLALSVERGPSLCLDWKRNSCASWVGDAIMFMTDDDAFHEFRNRCDSPFSYAKRLLELGHSSVESYIDSVLPEITSGVLNAHRGDVVLVPISQAHVEADGVPMEARAAVALADPPNFWVLTPNGVGRGVLLEATKAYRVGRSED